MWGLRTTRGHNSTCGEVPSAGFLPSALIASG